MVTFFETMIADNFENDFFVPNCTTTVNRLLRRTLVRSVNYIIKLTNSVSTIPNYKL
jgi:hypothetical protein